MRTDAEIQKDVMDELRWQPILNSSQIGVVVKDGIVTLSGNVDSYTKKLSAEKAAENILGVRAVAEDIEVKLASRDRKTDTEIAEAVLTALKWTAAVDEDRIRVKVEDGTVTLDGYVNWNFQRFTAKSAVAGLLGVKDVINNLMVKSSVTAVDVRSKIAAVFNRTAAFEGDNININVSGSIVTLSGTVASVIAKRAAESAAWLAPGVTKVINNLDVNMGVFA